MSQQPPPEPPDPPNDNGEDNGESGDLEKVPEDEVLEALLEKAPQSLIRATLIGIFREGASPRIDPDTYKLAAQTAQKEQDNRLTFLMRKLEVEDAQNTRQHEMDVKKHDLDVDNNRRLFNMGWLLLGAAVLVIVGGIASGIYLAATGKETLGFSILSSAITALFAYIGGLGTPRFWEKK